MVSALPVRGTGASDSSSATVWPSAIATVRRWSTYSGVENTSVYVPGASDSEYVPSSSAASDWLGDSLPWPSTRIPAAGKPSLVAPSRMRPRIVPLDCGSSARATPTEIPAATQHMIRALVRRGIFIRASLASLFLADRASRAAPHASLGPLIHADARGANCRNDLLCVTGQQQSRSLEAAGDPHHALVG